jgi:hypothetical protein
MRLLGEPITPAIVIGGFLFAIALILIPFGIVVIGVGLGLAP